MSEGGEDVIPPPAPHSAESVRKRAQEMWRGWVHRDLDTSEYEELFYRWLSSTPGRFQRNQEANRHMMSKPLLELLGRVNVPTLALVGRYSSVLGPAAGAQAVAQLSDGHLRVFEHSAHALPLEEPERFQAECAAFVHASRFTPY